MWALGKIHQRLNNDSAALSWFSEANRIESDNADILREATLCAMRLGNEGTAVKLAASAVELKPYDPGLVSNFALALLLAGRTDEASEKAADAVRANPDGKAARAVQKLIEDVVAGRKPRPRIIT
jgi:Flp pilus assembly protein TadD